MGVNVKRVKSISAEKISQNKVFELKDLFIYGLLSFFILALFLTTFLSCKKSNDGFMVSIKGTTVITHSYGKDFDIDKNWKDKITVSKTEDGYLIKIQAEDGGFNTIICNEKDKFVKMFDSDCPSGNCKYMNEIKNSGAIYCAPRDLKIVPLEFDGNLSPVTGGAG